ncbi:hypothetical protein niasHT_010631 [Heterodera trifolii]|uniref:HAT C-terminal dimerisation domain-containing protein n=1 Tax=Heterodera trifolii TaxID=157864 RepID=A0ABD2L974_9BILA
MAPPKRKNVFKSEYVNEFQGITKSKTGDELAHCIPCNFDISLLSIGKSAISHHLKTEKHKKAAKAANSAKAITAFMPSTSAPTNLDRQTAAAEGVWAYHTAQHAQSFKSANCVSDLLPKIFPDSKIAANYGSKRDKSAAIITRVLAPHSVYTTLQEMSGLPFSLSIDSSNHKTTKLFPLVVRYFNPKKGISVKLIDLEELGGETSAEIYNWIIKILERHKLDIAQLVAFCGDNVNANFGGAALAGQRNIYNKLKAHRNNLIPVGCPAHILHNSAKNGADNLPIDIESIVFKLASEFRNSTKRVERLKEIFEEFQANFISMNTHGPTRWTTLLLVVNKILHLWDIFADYFTSDGPLILRNFFASDSAKTVVTFLSVILPIFNHSIDKKNAILPELIEEMTNFKRKIQERFTEEFYGMITAQMLRRLDPNESTHLRASFRNFLQSTLNYVDKWFRVERFPTDLTWVSLKEKKVSRAEVMSLAEQIAPELNDNELFDEITALNETLEKISDEKFSEMNAEQKWMKLFEAELPSLRLLVSKILSIPVSNACVERVFSLCSAQWTDKASYEAAKRPSEYLKRGQNPKAPAGPVLKAPPALSQGPSGPGSSSMRKAFIHDNIAVVHCKSITLIGKDSKSGEFGVLFDQDKWFSNQLLFMMSSTNVEPIEEHQQQFLDELAANLPSAGRHCIPTTISTFDWIGMDRNLLNIGTLSNFSGQLFVTLWSAVLLLSTGIRGIMTKLLFSVEEYEFVACFLALPSVLCWCLSALISSNLLIKWSDFWSCVNFRADYTEMPLVTLMLSIVMLFLSVVEMLFKNKHSLARECFYICRMYKHLQEQQKMIKCGSAIVWTTEAAETDGNDAGHCRHQRIKKKWIKAMKKCALRFMGPVTISGMQRIMKKRIKAMKKRARRFTGPVITSGMQRIMKKRIKAMRKATQRLPANEKVCSTTPGSSDQQRIMKKRIKAMRKCARRLPGPVISSGMMSDQ